MTIIYSTTELCRDIFQNKTINRIRTLKYKMVETNSDGLLAHMKASVQIQLPLLPQA